MMPVSCGPNAIVYGSGCIPVTKMVRYGFALDLVGFIVVVLIVTLWAPLVLGR